MTAQRASDEIRESARREGEITIGEAELQAEKIVQGAHHRFLRIVDDIQEMKRLRVQFEASVRSLVEGHCQAPRYLPRRRRRRSGRVPGRAEEGDSRRARCRDSVRLGPARRRAPPRRRAAPSSSAAPSIARRTSASDRPPPPRPAPRAPARRGPGGACRASSRSAASAAVHPEHGDLDDVGGGPLDGRVHRHPLRRLPQRRDCATGSRAGPAACPRASAPRPDSPRRGHGGVEPALHAGVAGEVAVDDRLGLGAAACRAAARGRTPRGRRRCRS